MTCKLLKCAEFLSNVNTRYNSQSQNVYAQLCHLGFYRTAAATVSATSAIAAQQGAEGERKLYSQRIYPNPYTYLLLWSQIITSLSNTANRFYYNYNVIY